MKKPGDIFKMRGLRFEFIRMAKDEQGKFVEAWQLDKNSQRRFKAIIRPEGNHENLSK